MKQQIRLLTSKPSRRNALHGAIPGRREHHAIFLAVLVELEQQQQRLVTTKELLATLATYLDVSTSFDKVLMALEKEKLVTLRRRPHHKPSWLAISSPSGQRLAAEIDLAAVKARHEVA